MKKTLWTLLAVVLLGIGWWLGSPLFLDKKVNEVFPGEAVPSAAAPSQVSSPTESPQPITIKEFEGSFRDGDALHKAKGVARSETAEGIRYIRFIDFEATNGPVLHAYLRKKDQPTLEGIDLGKLKGNIGNQHYELPKDIDLAEYNTVVIYCKTFRVDVGLADLKSI